jgi:hypothetical protein
MTIDEVWDALLLPLADLFESGIFNRGIGPGPAYPKTFEAVRACLAIKAAEGSLVNMFGTDIYRLTSAGYLKYKARIDLLRAFANTDISSFFSN